jgi:hypothetical protein
MKSIRFFSSKKTKMLFMFCLLGSLTLSTTLDSLSLLTDASFEIANADWQADSDSENQEKEETKEKKIIPEFILYPDALKNKRGNHITDLTLGSYLTLFEIHLPPPEQV